MALLGWLWLGSPFALIALISHNPRLLSLVATHQSRCQAAGWTGAALMLLGAAVVPGVAGAVMFWIGTPLVGLVVWLRGDDGDDGGEPEPDVPPINWDEFERSFWDHVRRGGPPSGRPRVPAGG
jgi:hypothetical protein